MTILLLQVEISLLLEAVAAAVAASARDLVARAGSETVLDLYWSPPQITFAMLTIIFSCWKSMLSPVHILLLEINAHDHIPVWE